MASYAGSRSRTRITTSVEFATSWVTLKSRRLHRYLLKPDLLDVRFLSAQALFKSGRFAESEIKLRFVAGHDVNGIFRERIKVLQDEPAAGMTPRSTGIGILN
jgi:hypothetical protein